MVGSKLAYFDILPLCQKDPVIRILSSWQSKVELDYEQQS